MPEILSVSCSNCGAPIGNVMDSECSFCGSNFDRISTFEDMENLRAQAVVELFFAGKHTEALLSLYELIDKQYPLSKDQRDSNSIAHLKRCEIFMQVASFLKANKDKVPAEKGAMIDGRELSITPYDEVIDKKIVSERSGIVNGLILALKVEHLGAIEKLKSNLEKFSVDDRNQILELLTSLENEFPAGHPQREYSAATSPAHMTVVDKLAHRLGNEKNHFVTEKLMSEIFNPDKKAIAEKKNKFGWRNWFKRQ